MAANNIDTSELVSVRCGGTAVNTGARGGVRLLEEHVGKPLQWMVCQRHAYELPLHRLFQCFDRHTTGPCYFSGAVAGARRPCNGCKRRLHLQIK
jgi:hypothetical protein